MSRWIPWPTRPRASADALRQICWLQCARRLQVVLDDPAPVLQTTEDLFQASVTVHGPDGKARRVSIRQDSRVWTSGGAR